MPISRKKSCIPCRNAKARCNLERTCSRCVDRGIPCDYGDAQPRPRPPAARRRPQPSSSAEQGADTQISSAALASREGITGPIAITGIGSSNYGTGSSLDPPAVEGHSLMPDLLQDVNMESAVDTSAWSLDDWFFGDTMTSDRYNGFWAANAPPLPPAEAGCDRPREKDLHGSPPLTNLVSVDAVQGTMEEQHSLLIPPSYGSLHKCVSRFTHVFFPLSNSTGLATRHQNSPDGTLTLKRSPTHQSFLITQVLLGQISKYPQMMLQARLPPFVYPTCVLEGRLASACARDGHHGCLPEPLAICSSMVRMIASKGTHSCSFIWSMIMEQQKRLADHCEGYDIETLLAATQASLVYVLLVAQDASAVPSKDIECVIATFGELVSRLHSHQQKKYTTNIYLLESLGQREWVLYESTRRIVCLLFVLEALLDLIVGPRDSPECPGFSMIPLPCTRDLWDYEHRDAWGYRLRQYMDRRGEDGKLTLRDLLQARKPILEPQVVEKAGDRLMAEMARWCTDIDEFGTLVWMAALLD